MYTEEETRGHALFNPLRPRDSYITGSEVNSVRCLVRANFRGNLPSVRISREFLREFAERANFVTSVENKGMALQLASCEDQEHSTATVSTKNKFNIIIYVKSLCNVHALYNTNHAAGTKY